MKRELKKYGPISRHGEYPFEIAYLYCMEVDSDFTQTRKTWLMIMLDDFSKRVLACNCTFEKPSCHRVTMLLMECVHRFNALPQTIVTNNGEDFKSIYFKTFIEQYGMILVHRPPKAYEDKYFKTLTSQVQMMLKSNTPNMENSYQDSMVNSMIQAFGALTSLNELFKEYFYETYDTTEHVAIGESPRNAFERGIALSGPIRFIPSVEQSTEKCKLRKKENKMLNDNQGFANQEQIYSLNVIILEHMQLDVFVMDDETGEILGRPWLTVAFDFNTRMIWGMETSLKYPSQKVIENSVLFNRAKEQGYTIIDLGIDGIFKVIFEVTDETGEKIVEQLEKVWTVKSITYKGSVERQFGKLTSELKRLEGTDKPLKPKNYMVNEGAKLGLRELKEVINTYLELRRSNFDYDKSSSVEHQTECDS